MIIYQDTREKKPWTFSLFPDVEVIRKKVDYGDYTLGGYEDQVAIERKRNTAEIAGNITTQDKHRFHREMEEFQHFRHAYIICEFLESDLLTFPKNSGIPAKYHKKLRVSGKYLHKVMAEVSQKYDVQIVYCRSPHDAEEFVMNLFNTIVGKVKF
jgi:ERCC4-type nuclease